jgi:hypothetical protein
MNGLRHGERRGLSLFIGIVVMAAVAALAGEAAAQPSPFASGARGALRPDFLRRDLVQLINALRLDDEQKLVVETLFADYEAAFDAGMTAVRKRMAEIRPAPAAPDAAQRAAQQELRDELRALLDEARERAREAATEEERRRIMDDYQQRMRELRERMQDLSPGPRPPGADDEMAAEIDRELEVWQEKKTGLKNGFFAGVQAVLRDEQRALWPAFERRLRREKTIAYGQLSGESIDLFRVLRGLDLPAEAEQAIASTLEAYDLRLDAALRARNGHSEESQQALSDALRAGNQDGAMAIVDRQIALSQVVRDVNLEFAPAIAAGLPEEWGGRFTGEVNRTAFGRVYRSDRVQRMFEAALQLEDLDEQIRESIEQLQQACLSELAARNEQLRQTIIAHEPAEIRGRYERRVPQEGGPRTTGREDPIQAAYDARREVEDQYIAQLRELLTEEQFRELPGGRRGAGRGGTLDRRRGSGGPGRESWMRDRFDEDGDGRLNDAEREALLKYLRERRRGNEDL